MKEKKLPLSFIWKIRLKLWAEGNKLREEGDKLMVEGDKLRAEGVIEAHGNISMTWEFRDGKKDFACILETGEVLEP
jgi:hypothetical protein